MIPLRLLRRARQKSKSTPKTKIKTIIKSKNKQEKNTIPKMSTDNPQSDSKLEDSPTTNELYHDPLSQFLDDFSNPSLSDPEDQSSEAVCEVCNDSDYGESLLTCSKCSLSVHQRCYKATSPLDWVCDMCCYFPPNTKLPCVLCPKRGGALKQSIHLTTACPFPGYSPIKFNFKFKFKSKDKNEGMNYIWVHAFCALHTPGVSFKAPRNRPLRRRHLQIHPAVRNLQDPGRAPACSAASTDAPPLFTRNAARTSSCLPRAARRRYTAPCTSP